MAYDINVCVLTGNLTRDAEFKQTATGTIIYEFGLASNDSRKNKQTGEYEDHANFVTCTLVGERAEKLAPYLKKGLRVALQGKLSYSSWTDDMGQNRSTLKIFVAELRFMDRKGANQGSAQQQPAMPAQAYPQAVMQPQFSQQMVPQTSPMPYPQAVAPQVPQATQTPQQVPQQAQMAPQQPQVVYQSPAGAPMSSYYDEEIPF